MFSKIEELNQIWLKEKENLLEDAQLLIAQLSYESGMKMKRLVDILKALNTSQKNAIYKDIFFLNWIRKLNSDVLCVYEISNKVWNDENLDIGIECILAAISNLKKKRGAFLSLPQVSGIKIANRKIESFLTEIIDLVDVEFEFVIDENKWLSDLDKAIQLIKYDSNSYKLLMHFVSYIIPLKQNTTLRNLSFSTKKLPNVIFKNNEEIPYLFGETLVHEADHQFFYALEEFNSFWITNVDLQKPVHFSPWRDDARPLDGIIRGLSAFVRVCHYYSKIISNVEGEDINNVGELLLTKLVQCEDAYETVTRSNQLSKFGNNYVHEMKRILDKVDNSVKHLANYRAWRDTGTKGINIHKERCEWF